VLFFLIIEYSMCAMLVLSIVCTVFIVCTMYDTFKYSVICVTFSNHGLLCVCYF